jgi:hypothetical protein
MTGPLMHRAALVLFLTVLAAGCGSTHRTTPRAPVEAIPVLPDEDCQPRPGVPARGGVLTFTLTEPVQPDHAPVPHNLSERLAFRNLYQTLVEVGCDGLPQPGLAVAWESQQGNRYWVFTLRAGVRFWDDTPFTASEVKACWIGTGACPRAGLPHSPLTWLDPREESVRVLDDRRLAIRLPEPQADLPLLLAHPALAVAARRPGSVWPIGTGPFRLEPDAGPPSPDLVCLASGRGDEAPRLDRLVFRILPGRDPRDLLGPDGDALLVRDREQLAYFERAPGVTVTPLLWDRLYLVLCPPTGPDRERQRWYTGWNRRELATDVVSSSATAAAQPFFVLPEDELCPQLTGPIATVDFPPFDWPEVNATLDRDLILFPAGDRDARRLAERIAVLAADPLRPDIPRPGRGRLSPPPPPTSGQTPQAVAVPPADLPGAIQSERAGAYVFALGRHYPSACLQLATLLGKAEWIQRAALDPSFAGSIFPASATLGDPVGALAQGEVAEAAERLRLSGTAVPLVFTRPHLVHQGNLVGLRLTFDGTVLLDRAGWAESGRSFP